MNINENPWPIASARIGLIALLMAAPLAFGAVQPWAWGAMTVVVACLLVLWAVGCLHTGMVTLVWSWLYIPALALLALASVQLRFGLTMDHIGTREAIIKLLTYVAIFFLTQQLFSHEQLAISHQQSAKQEQQVTGSKQQAGRSPDHPITRSPDYFALAITIYAFLMSVFAIIQFFASPGLLYGIIKPRWGGYVFGPYVYHNAYAGLMEMLIPISVSYVLSQTVAPRAEHRAPRASSIAVLLFFILICVVSVFLSGSRGGVIALAVEFGIFILVILRLGSASNQKSRIVNRKWLLFSIARSRPERSRMGHRITRLLLVSFCLLLFAALLFSWLDSGDVWKRWEAAAHAPELAMEYRDTLTLDSLRMSRHHLVHGVGVGAFEVAYPRYQTIATDALIDYAHNDYAQLVAEAGIVGWILALASVALFLWVALRCLGFRKPQLTTDNSQPAAWVSVGAAIGACGILVHSFSDFNLHIPANAAWFAVCCALTTLLVAEPHAVRGD